MNQSVTKKDLLEVRDEIVNAVASGFSAVEENAIKSEKRLGQRIDGIRTSLDAEILRRADDFSRIEKRLSALETIHGIEA